MMHVLFREGLEDGAYLRRVHGRMAKSCATHALKAEHAPRASGRSDGIDAETIEWLALAYGARRTGWAPAGGDSLELRDPARGEWRNGGARGGDAAADHRKLEAARRRIVAVDQRGVSVQPAKLQMPELMQASPLGRAARMVNMNELGDALTELGQGGSKGHR